MLSQLEQEIDMKHLTMTSELAAQIEKIRQWLNGRECTYVEQVWCAALGKKLRDYDRRASVRMSIILTTYCGWVKSGVRERVDGVQKWVYHPTGHVDRFADVLG